MAPIPINVEFAASSLDPMMADDRPEVRGPWRVIRRDPAEVVAQVEEADANASTGGDAPSG